MTKKIIGDMEPIRTKEFNPKRVEQIKRIFLDIYDDLVEEMGCRYCPAIWRFRERFPFAVTNCLLREIRCRLIESGDIPGRLRGNLHPHNSHYDPGIKDGRLVPVEDDPAEVAMFGPAIAAIATTRADTRDATKIEPTYEDRQKTVYRLAGYRIRQVNHIHARDYEHFND